MQITLAHIGPRSGKTGTKSHYEALTRLYLDRIAPYFACRPEAFASEAALLAWLAQPRQSGKAARVPALPVLLDSRGRMLGSGEFAAWVAMRRDQGAQHIVFAVGPADGWSDRARELAQAPPGMLLSFGPITMAHELARLVLAEQVYRACTILVGHPYHSSH